MKIFVMSATMLVLMLSLAFAGDLQRLLSVKEMTCTACPPQVESELKKVPGVRTAQVDLKSGQAKVVFKAEEQESR